MYYIYHTQIYTICIPQTQPMMLLSQKLSLRKREVNVWSTNLPDWYSDYFSVNFVLWWWLSGTQYTPLLLGRARSSGYFLNSFLQLGKLNQICFWRIIKISNWSDLLLWQAGLNIAHFRWWWIELCGWFARII